MQWCTHIECYPEVAMYLLLNVDLTCTYSCLEILENEDLCEILSVVLVTGNFVNMVCGAYARGLEKYYILTDTCRETSPLPMGDEIVCIN